MTAANNNIEWFTEADIVSTLTLGSAAEFLKPVLVQTHQGSVESMPKIMSSDPLRSIHCLGAAETQGRFSGFKCWVNSAKGGAIAVYLLFDIEQGRLLAMMEAGALGALRTAGIALLAAQHLRPAGQARIAVIGTGRQAMTQLAAALLALNAKAATVWSPTREKREGFALKASTLFNADVRCADTLESAVRDANLIVSVTRSPDPVLFLNHLQNQDVHINAMGAIFPDRAELAPDIVSKASLVVVDDISRATSSNRELAPWLKIGSHVPKSLGEWIDHNTERLPGISIFKSWGLAASDLAMARAVYLAKAGESATQIAYPVPATAAMLNSLSGEFASRVS